MKKLLIPLLGCLLALVPARVNSYVYCGYHTTGIALTAYYWNSEFWVNMLVSEAYKWNAIYPVLTINRTKSATIPLRRDNNNVVGWLNETDLKNNYGLSWANNIVGWAVTWKDVTCGRVLEADVFFNPAITLFTQQTEVPYRKGYQEIALHELGHVCAQDHEDRILAVMTAAGAVSDVLYASDKIGWYYSAKNRFAPTDKRDMGIYPLRNTGNQKTYSTIYPNALYKGNYISVRDFTIQNLSVGIAATNIPYKVYLQNLSTYGLTEIGSFVYNGGGFTQWEGNMSFYVPTSITAGSYKVWAACQTPDMDYTNTWAQFGKITVY
ncbi:hypothetical protein V9K67_14580 [Paraflavisolibacter sp. H34]|uniref:hypothetical protein n=1 Tax=Huijunlia imazamoxiresistens TaxID=3127457 RepID=UPI003016233D